MPNRALRIGDPVTFREENYEQVRRAHTWLAKTDWSAWSKSGIPLTLSAEYAGGRSNRRRAFMVRTPKHSAVVWPCEIKLDDRELRKKVHDEIWAEREANRAARAKGARKK